jgi:5-methylcytosine-specific restriction protein A
MAYINLPKKSKRNDSSNNPPNHKFYNTSVWRKLRLQKLAANPLCEDCLNNDNRITPATDIHHIIEFSKGKTEAEKWSLFLDWENLSSLCKDCHKKYGKF